MILPGIPVLNKSLQLSPIVSHFFDVCFQIVASSVSLSSSFPFPFWYPGEDSSCQCCQLACRECDQSISGVSVGSPVQPASDIYVATTVHCWWFQATRHQEFFIDSCRQSSQSSLWWSLWSSMSLFRKNSLGICIENPDIVFQGKDFEFPNVLEVKKGHPCLADPGFNVCFCPILIHKPINLLTNHKNPYSMVQMSIEQ